MNNFDTIMILDGAENADAQALADATCAFLNGGGRPSTGTMSRNLRLALDMGIVERVNGTFVPVEEMILELEEMMDTF